MATTTQTLRIAAAIAATFSAFARPVTAEGDLSPIAIYVDDHAHPSPAALAAVALTASSMVRQTKATDEHVRSPQAVVTTLLREGAERSGTFSALVEMLNGSDVVAYVESSLQLRTGLDGYLTQRVIVAGNRRYLHILVNAELRRDRLLAIIAHELQHAVEVAQTPAAQSDEAVRALFQQLDSGRCAPRCTETDEAMNIQAAVLRELIASRHRR
jgi:hypothetical protein